MTCDFPVFKYEQHRQDKDNNKFNIATVNNIAKT